MITRETLDHGTTASPRSPTQDVSLSNIDPGKLASKLQRLFGDDSFEVYVRYLTSSAVAAVDAQSLTSLKVKHDAYCIQAPRTLSQVESFHSAGDRCWIAMG